MDFSSEGERLDRVMVFWYLCARISTRESSKVIRLSGHKEKRERAEVEVSNWKIKSKCTWFDIYRNFSSQGRRDGDTRKLMYEISAWEKYWAFDWIYAFWQAGCYNRKGRAFAARLLPMAEQGETNYWCWQTLHLMSDYNLQYWPCKK